MRNWRLFFASVGGRTIVPAVQTITVYDLSSSVHVDVHVRRKEGFALLQHVAPEVEDEKDGGNDLGKGENNISSRLSHMQYFHSLLKAAKNTMDGFIETRVFPPEPGYASYIYL